MNRFSFERRIARAEELAAIYPFAKEILLFYQQVLMFQSSVQPGDFAATVPRLLTLVEATGTPQLVEASRDLCSKGIEYWNRFLDDFWRSRQSEIDSEAFFAKVLLERWLPEEAQIERRGGLFGEKRIVAVRLHLGEYIYSVELPARGLSCLRRAVVRKASRTQGRRIRAHARRLLRHLPVIYKDRRSRHEWPRGAAS